MRRDFPLLSILVRLVGAPNILIAPTISWHNSDNFALLFLITQSRNTSDMLLLTLPCMVLDGASRAAYCFLPVHCQHCQWLALYLLLHQKLTLTSVSDYCSSPDQLLQGSAYPHPLPFSSLLHLLQLPFASLLSHRPRNSPRMSLSLSLSHTHTHTQSGGTGSSTLVRDASTLLEHFNWPWYCSEQLLATYLTQELVAITKHQHKRCLNSCCSLHQEVA
jgi:hypothetical protein